MKRAVFLDRDGVITQEPPYYAHKVEQLAVIPGAAQAIRKLNQKGFLVIIISNQAGIAHGYFKEENTAIFNRALARELKKDNAVIDKIYICPHHPEAEVMKYRVKCDCRKPEPGLLIKAEKELNIDLKTSFMVGDKKSDIEAGKRAGCKTIIVKTGQGQDQLKNNAIDCDFVAKDLLDATGYIN